MRRYILLGLAVYVFYVVANFPAASAIKWFAPDTLRVFAAQGSIWRGDAQAVQVEQLMLGKTEWQVKPWHLLRGQVRAALKTNLGQSKLNTTVSRSVFGNALHLTDVQGIVFLADVPAQFLPQPVNGRLGIAFDHITLDDGWPTAALGSIDLVELAVPRPFQADLGSFEIAFSGESANEQLIGNVSDSDSTLTLVGTLTLTTDRRYVLDAKASASADAPSEIRDSLPFFGQADADGAVRISFEGQVARAPVKDSNKT